MQPLAVIGNVNVDLILGPAEAWPRPGSEIVVEHDELRVGGSAANSALVWKALGAEFQFVANTGSDFYGQWLRDSLAPHSEHWPVTPGPSTVSVGIIHPDGERTFFTTKGHLASLALTQVCAGLDWDRLKDGWLLLCGSFLTDALTSEYSALFKMARTNGVRIALDTGWPPSGWSGPVRKAALEWLRSVDCLLVNEAEALSLAGEEVVDRAAKRLREALSRDAILVVKRGALGALVLDNDGTSASAVAPDIDVVDSIGAGDVFNAAFLHALASGSQIGEAVEFGVGTASLAISTHPRRYE